MLVTIVVQRIHIGKNKSGPTPDPLEAGHADCNDQVNVGDGVYLIAYVFKGDPSHVTHDSRLLS